MVPELAREDRPSQWASWHVLPTDSIASGEWGGLNPLHAIASQSLGLSVYGLGWGISERGSTELVRGPAPEWYGAMAVLKIMELAGCLPWNLGGKRRRDAGQPTVTSREAVKARRLAWQHMKRVLSLFRAACANNQAFHLIIRWLGCKEHQNAQVPPIPYAKVRAPG